MKLTDFCILFAALFVCLFLGRDLRIRAMLADSAGEISYNRQMDRIDEDVLMDLVETEDADGTLFVRTWELEERLERLLALAFDLPDDDLKLRAREAVTVYCFRQYPYRISAQEVDAVIENMEAEANAAKCRRRETQHFKIAMPYRTGEPWYQPPSGPQLLTVFDLREPSWGYERAVFGGGRIVKLTAGFRGE